MITILRFLLTLLLTNKAAQKLFVKMAEHFAAKTDNDIDDRMVSTAKKALGI